MPGDCPRAYTDVSVSSALLGLGEGSSTKLSLAKEIETFPFSVLNAPENMVNWKDV